MANRSGRLTWAASALTIVAALFLIVAGVSQRGQASSPVPVAGARCDGSSINIANPQLLADVPGGQLFCDFHTFAWNQFIYLTQMQPDPNNNNQVTPLFLHLAPWYNMLPQSGTAAPGPYPGGSTALMTGPMDKLQAGDQDQLLDVNGHVVLYDIRFNQPFYASVVAQKLYNDVLFDQACAQDAQGNCTQPLYLPATGSSAGTPGAIEIKTAWRDFGAPGNCPTNFYCNGRFGLVGMHIVQKTATHGEWIWASFEHQANAPDCYPGGDSPLPAVRPSGKPWSFFDPTRATDDVFATRSCRVTGTTAQCNTDPRYFITPKLPPLYKPINVCRTDAIAAGGATAANCEVVQDGPPQQNSNSAGNVACLNATLMPKLSGVWKNYKMIGSLWVRGQTPPNQDFRIQVFQPQPQVTSPLTPYGQAVGFPHLANTTMETWMQWGSTGYDPFASATSYGTNATQAGCFLCHNPPSTGTNGFSRTADLSHFPDRLGQGVQQARRAALVGATSTVKVDATRMAQPPVPGGGRPRNRSGAKTGTAASTY